MSARQFILPLAQELVVDLFAGGGGALLMYAKHPATPNSPHWVAFMVPDDFITTAEQALADECAPRADPFGIAAADVPY